MNKAITVRKQGDIHAALPLYDQAIALYEQLVPQGRKDLAADLGEGYTAKAKALVEVEGRAAAAEVYGQTIELYEQLVHEDGRAGLAPDLAVAYMNKAEQLATLGDDRGAVPLYDQAIAIREQLVQEGHRGLLVCTIATKLINAEILLRLGERSRAGSLAQPSVAALEELITRTGRTDLNELLEWANSTFAEVL